LEIRYQEGINSGDQIDLDQAAYVNCEVATMGVVDSQERLVEPREKLRRAKTVGRRMGRLPWLRGPGPQRQPSAPPPSSTPTHQHRRGIHGRSPQHDRPFLQQQQLD
jgi:hypothetical protein